MGILNVTPDSFSDGGEFFDPGRAIEAARLLKESGADIIDIGGDSTRPGSKCVGEKEEWIRIEAVLASAAAHSTVSVDTHHARTAYNALSLGAQIINDVSGGSDPEMFRVVANAGREIVIMYSRCSVAHHFDKPTPNNLIDAIKDFFENRIIAAEKAGLRRENMIFDPGMGGFISPDPKDSFLILRELGSFLKYQPLLIGISRKGFLSPYACETPEDRDPLGAMLATQVALRFIASQKNLIIRTHNPRLQRHFLEAAIQV